MYIHERYHITKLQYLELLGMLYNKGNAPVAQRIRVLGFEPSGRTFESCRAYHDFMPR